MTGTPRVSPVSPEAWTDEQRRVHDMIAAGPRGGVSGPLAIWLNRPGLAEQAQALGHYCRYESSLTPRLSKLAILTIARHWNAEYEWWANKHQAIQNGLSIAVIDAIRDRTPPPFTHSDEASVFEFVTTLHTQRSIPSELYGKALAILGQDALIDLVGIVGYYTLIAMTINVFELDVPASELRELT